jgi:hypothetical protein
MPLIIKMEDAIVQNAHLIEGDGMPRSFTSLMSHAAAYKAVIRNWHDATARDLAEGTPDQVEEKHTAVINFPDKITAYSARMLRSLKARQLQLIATTRVEQDVSGIVATRDRERGGDGTTGDPERRSSGTTDVP